MEAVHVFGGIDGFEDALGVHLGRKGKLNQNAVDVVVTIQILDNSQQIEGGHIDWRRDESAGEADLFAGSDFTFDVELRSGVLADKDGGETGTNARGGEEANFIFQLGEDLVANFGAIQDSCGHAVLAFDMRVRCKRKS